MRSQALDRAAHRIVWTRRVGIVLALLLAGRAAQLAVDNGRTRRLFQDQVTTEEQLAPARGTIFDREGRELAITTEAASVYALPRLVEDPTETATRLAHVLGLDRDRLARRLAERERFTYLARWVSREQAETVRGLALAGIGIDLEPRRSYPAGKLAAPLIGFANIDGEGVRGIEQMEDAWLKGRPRSVRIERDARGRTLALRSTDPRDVQGGELSLTLDAVMQGAAEAALHDAVAAHDAVGGSVVTLDPETGDVLALAEAPGFDPNRFRELDYGDTRARVFTDLVEPGSTMKAFLVAAALEAGSLDASTTIDTGEGSLRVRGKTIRDARAHGPLDPTGVLRVSSNVGAVQIAQELGREAHYEALRRFGFGRTTGSGFPMESPGLVRDWRDWRPVDQATVAFGQGLSVTSIQLASALAALAHDGVRMQPRLVRARRRSGEAWETVPSRPVGRAVSREVAHRTLDMLRSVVSAEGTGRLAALRDVPVAGKTGTAQKLDREHGRYSHDRYRAWFMGVVPANDPELVIVVVIDEPGGAVRGGGSVAAPVFARIAAAQLARRGIVTEPQPIPAAPVEETRFVEAAEPVEETRFVEAAEPVEETRFVAAAEPVEETRFVETAEPRDLPVPSGRTAPATPRTPSSNSQPPRAAGAAPPARPAVQWAAGPPPSSASAASPGSGASPSAPADRGAARRPGATAAAPAFVPDFSGQTVERALALARSESLVLRLTGAREGRVVSQVPVPGTVLHGEDRTVRLALSPTPEEG